MSDEESMHSEEEEEEEVEEEEEEEEPMGEYQDSGPSEAELAVQKRMKAQAASLDESAQEMLEQNRLERVELDKEIKKRRHEMEKRRKEREQQEKKMAAKRNEADAIRKAEEESRRMKKEEEQAAKRAERENKAAEQEKRKNPQGRNFVITKKESKIKEEVADDSEEVSKDEPREERKSKEQLEVEKQAIISQRIQPLNIEGLGTSQLGDKLKDVHKHIQRLESEKYDLEKRFRKQTYDMMELAERARQMIQIGRTGLKRVTLCETETDDLQERFAGCPAKIEMYNKFERQNDKRPYGDRRTMYTGPSHKFQAEKIGAKRIVSWAEDTGLPIYTDMGGADGAPAEAPPAEEAQAEVPAAE